MRPTDIKEGRTYDGKCGARRSVLRIVPGVMPVVHYYDGLVVYTIPLQTFARWAFSESFTQSDSEVPNG